MYRNKRLLRLAKHCPRCMACGLENNGSVVAAHSNQMRDGKGMGIKAHDYRIAYLCFACHAELDQGIKEARAGKNALFEEAHRKSIGWMFESGFLEVISA